MIGPEERYEDKCIWMEERCSEEPKLTKDEIYKIRVDESKEDLWNNVRAHRIFGRHSNIPTCCIDAYCMKRFEDRNTVFPPNPKFLVGYQRCLRCISIDYVQRVHYCTPKCTKWLQKNVPWFTSDWFTASY